MAKLTIHYEQPSIMYEPLSIKFIMSVL